jgi:hypothetical protein
MESAIKDECMNQAYARALHVSYASVLLRPRALPLVMDLALGARPAASHDGAPSNKRMAVAVDGSGSSSAVSQLRRDMDKLLTVVDHHDKSISELKAAMLEVSFKMDSNMRWVKEAVLERKQYSKDCLAMKEQGIMQEQIEETKGKPHVHVWNAMVKVTKLRLQELLVTSPADATLQQKMVEMEAYIAEYSLKKDNRLPWQRIVKQVSIATITELSHRNKGSARIEIALKHGSDAQKLFQTVMEPIMALDAAHKEFYGGAPRGKILKEMVDEKNKRNPRKKEDSDQVM